MLWAAVFLVASVIYRPVEQLLSRTIAERRARGPADRLERCGSRPRSSSASCSRFVAVALLCAGPIEDELFSGSSTLYWCLVAAVRLLCRELLRARLPGRGAALRAVRRAGADGGRLARRVRRAAGVGVLDGAQRGRDRDRGRAAAEPVRRALGAGTPRAPHRRAAARRRPRREPEFTLAHGLGFAGAVLVIMVSEQAILNSGVLIVKVETGDDALAALIFAVLMIARAPLQLFQAVSTTLLPHLTRLLVREDEASTARRLRPQRAPHGAGMSGVRGRDRGRRAGRRAGGDEAAVRLGVRLRPARPRDGGRRHGPVPVGHDGQPGRAGAGPRPPGRGVLGRHGGVLRRLPAAGRAWRRCARSRSRSSPPPACCRRCCTSSTAARAAGQRPIQPGSTEEMGVILAAADEGS